MLTAQNNQPDDKDASVQIDADLQQTIDQIARDLDIEPSYGDSDQVLSGADAEKLLIADHKIKVDPAPPPSPPASPPPPAAPSPPSPAAPSATISVPKLDPVQVSAKQADQQVANSSVPEVDTSQIVTASSDQSIDQNSVATDDLGITEPIFSQPIPVVEPGASQVEQSGGEAKPEPSDIVEPSDTVEPSFGAEPVSDAAPSAVVEQASESTPVEAVTANTEVLPSVNNVPANFSMTNSFFDVLVNKGKITPEQAEELRQENLSKGSSYEELVLSKQLASETDVVQAKAEFNNVPYIKLSAIGVDPEALTLLDEGIAKRYQVLPFGVDKQKNSLKVAMIDPLDLAAIEFLKQKTSHNIEAHFAENSDILRMIDEYYAQSLSTEVTEALKSTTQHDDRQSTSVELNQQAGAILRDAPINRIVENILDYAMKSSASDIHIEPQIGRTRVRYRIDGILAEKLILPQNVHEAVVSRIKIMANLKIDEKRLPQDGRFNYKSNSAEIDLRTSTLPTVHGEKVVMRLLKKDAAVPSLEDLGLMGLGLKKVKEAIKIPYGIILITGPTGSGKTTTLYSILNIINKVGVNIMTLEDPVEYQIAGVSQVQTNPKAGLTFASGLRSFLRQDPDIIMVGEIRDNETADLALQASLTGHLVFSTLHTNSAAGALPRLLDMEAEPFLLASSITLSMGQRVVRKINDKYKEEYTPEPVVVEDIKKALGVHFERWCKEKGKDPNKITLFRPSSKRPATEPEYKGRIGIFEVMPNSPEIASLILNRRPANELEKTAIQQGMTLMKQDGYLKVLEGITTVEEVLRVAEVS